MVQIIDEQPFFAPLSRGIEGFVQQQVGRRQNEQLVNLAQNLGIIPAGLDSSELRDIDSQQLGNFINQRMATQARSSSQKSPQQIQQEAQDLAAAGMPENELRLYQSGSDGTRLELMRHHLDQVSRGYRKPRSTQTLSEVEREGSIENRAPISVSEPDESMLWPDLQRTQGITSKEEAGFRKQREKQSDKELITARSAITGLEKETVDLGILKDLNERGNLPEGLASLLIDPSTGDIRPTAQLAGMVNKDTQQFAKTIANFISGAKNIFGSRVTNFDLEAFLKRLPGLLNSSDGRRIIIEQMNLQNKRDMLHNKLLRDGIQHYDNNYSFAQVTKAVDDRIAREEADIMQRYDLLTEAGDYLDMMAKNPTKFAGHELFIDDKGKLWAVPPDKFELASRKMKPWRI